MHSTLFIIFLFIFVSNSYEHSIKKSSKWDYVVFTQQWPPAVCRNEVVKKCSIPANVTSWTVHGIWPTGRHNPTFCNDSLGFNVSQIKSIESELLVVWPNLFPNTPTYSFWAHEWKKHGTCIVSVPQLDNELKYFTMAIYFHNKYNFKMLLENGGILPDEKKFYDIEELHRVVEHQLGKRVGFECAKQRDNFSLLFNSYICLNKNLELIDCNNDRHCKGTKIIYLPMERNEFFLTRLVFVHVPRYLGVSSVCYVISGSVLFLSIIVIAILINSFKKDKRKLPFSVDEKMKN